MPVAPYDIELTVTVPATARPARRVEWRACPLLEELTAVDQINSWSDLDRLFAAHGNALARVLRETRYRGFRIAARGALSRRLLGIAEWHRSLETGAHLPAATWTAQGLFPLNPWGAGPIAPIDHVATGFGA